MRARAREKENRQDEVEAKRTGFGGFLPVLARSACQEDAANGGGGAVGAAAEKKGEWSIFVLRNAGRNKNTKNLDQLLSARATPPAPISPPPPHCGNA
jgi:hypothetical protein